MDAAELSELVELSSDQLLQELVLRADRAEILYSPAGFRQRLDEILSKLTNAAKSALCPQAELLDSAELDLATQILSLLQSGSDIPERLLAPLALYIARVGVARICADSAT